MPFTIVRQDITKMQVDAIVNAANTALEMGGGVCGAIFRAAGVDKLQKACDALAPVKTGEAVITPGFDLPATYIIHTAGPVYKDGQQGEEELLRACYTNSLKRALENNCKNIAFPLISSGIYGYPKEEALQLATSAIKTFLEDHEMNVYLVVFDKTAYQLSKSLIKDVESYIDEHYVEVHLDRGYRRNLLEVELLAMKNLEFSVEYSSLNNDHATLEDLVGNLDEPFAQTLLRLIDAKGKTDVEVYKKANIDRKLFSKIRTRDGYTPGKRTILALSIGLGLSLEETKDLLKRAGYALSQSQKFDVIVEYFLVRKKYDIFEINQVLFAYDQPLLGG